MDAVKPDNNNNNTDDDLQALASKLVLTGEHVEIFKCKLCSQLLVDPVTLPCCASLVCASHVDVLESTTYNCDICHRNSQYQYRHHDRKNYFRAEKRRSGVFEQLSMINPKQFARVAKEMISKAEKTPKEPKLAVFEFFVGIKQQLDTTREEIRLELGKEIDVLNNGPRSKVVNKKEITRDWMREYINDGPISDFSENDSDDDIEDADKYDPVTGALNSKIDKEKELGEMDKHSNKLIRKLTEWQVECVDLVETLEPWYNETSLKDLKALVQIVETESLAKGQFKQINLQILELILKCDHMLDCVDHVSFLEQRYTAYLSEIIFIFGFCVKPLEEHNIKPLQSISKFLESAKKQQKKYEFDRPLDSNIMPYFQYQLFDMYSSWEREFGDQHKENSDECNDSDEEDDCCSSPVCKWNLVYRGSKDGFSAKDFHSKCDGIKNTLTLVKSTDGSIFGGYTKKKWKSGVGKWFDDSRASIFSVLNKEHIPFRRNVIESKSAIWCSAYNGPCFGQDIWISSDSNVNDESYCNLGHSFQRIEKLQDSWKDNGKHDDDFEFGTDRAKSLLAGSFHFRTAEIEVFEFY